MTIKPADLPAEIQKILDSSANEGACFSDQPVCTPDARVTAQLVSNKPVEKTLPWRIVGAQKGDLLLCPGGPGGLIGGLLSQLAPAQIFSHMGIFTQDEVEVRHCTMNEAWLNDHAESGDQPTDGFEEDALRHGWPGTVTQSVEEAYYNAKGPDTQKVKRHNYLIDALGFDPSLIRLKPEDEEFSVVWPLLVTACPDRPEVRDALHRIADAAKDLRGHYRFYAYTKADVALDPAYAGPARAEADEPDPTSQCVGKKPHRPVTRTLPLVCSTFIWAAVNEANRRGGKPIVVDGRDADPVKPMCLPEREPHPYADPQPPGTPNGLYIYSETQRKICASWLQSYLVNKVWAGVQEEAGHFVLAVLYEAFSDIASDVANQITNAFVSDDCSTASKDSDAWTNPGPGVSVSPDDILNNWTAPEEQRSAEQIIGVYGHSTQVALRPPEWTAVAPAGSTWQISQGPAYVHGHVEILLDDGSRIPAKDAHVRVGCTKWVTTGKGAFPGQEGRMEVPSGAYWAACWWRDPQTGAVLEAHGRPIELALNQDEEIEFLITSPPVRRRVWMAGHLDMVNRYAIGHDWWGHPGVLTSPALVTWGHWPTQAEQDAAASGHTGGGWSLDDWGSCEINCDLKVDSTGALTAHVTARLRHGDDDDPLQYDQTFAVPPKKAAGDPPFTIAPFDMVRSPDAWPVRAHCEIFIHNDPAP
jgi:hypothetical protein